MSGIRILDFKNGLGMVCLLVGASLFAANNPDLKAFVTTLITRTAPLQSNAVLAAAPIAHGDPASEAEFVNASDRTPVDSYDDLGEFTSGDAAPRILRNNLGVVSTRSHAASIFYALHTSDLQVVDDKSPGITPTNDFSLDGLLFQGSYRPHSPYLPRMANALVKTSNMLALRSHRYDLMVHTGDAIENAQKNELQMFLTLFNGGMVNPDSGDHVDLIPGPDNDPKDPFRAVGLGGTPWYSIVGNHDILGQGNFPIGLLHFFNAPQVSLGLQRSFGSGGLTIPELATAAERRDILQPAQLFLMPKVGVLAGLNKKLELHDLLSRTKFSKAFAEFFNQGNPIPQAITPDPARIQLTRCDFIAGHLHDGGIPKGHGFSEDFNGSLNGQCAGYYAFTPETNPNFRFIALDSSYEYGGDDGVLGLPQKPFNIASLIDGAGNLRFDINSSDPAGATSTGFSSNTNGTLKRPGSDKPLFLVPARQGQAETQGLEDSRRNQLLFLQHELKTAQERNQLVVVTSHHASEVLYTYNKLRMQIESIVCHQLKAVDSNLDCNAADGTQATGNPGDSMVGPQAVGNAQARDLFAMIVGLVLEEPVYSFEDLRQNHIQALATQNPAVFNGLVGAFNLIFSLRNILPDPILPAAPMDTSHFRRLLASYPNVILHLAGHSHYHRILAICNNGVAIRTSTGECKDVGASAGTGYYEVRTAANADWPQEWRILEFADNNDGTLSIFGTVFGPAKGQDLIADAGRRLALADIETLPGRYQGDNSQDLNVELIVPISHAIEEKLAKAPNRHTQIESLTTLTRE